MELDHTYNKLKKSILTLDRVLPSFLMMINGPDIVKVDTLMNMNGLDSFGSAATLISFALMYHVGWDSGERT